MGIAPGLLQSERTRALAGGLLTLLVARRLAAGPGPAGATTRLREEDVPRYQPVNASDSVLGRIEIPRVGVSSPILQGVDYKTIRRAVGHFPETPLPGESGNMALAAHRTTDFYGLRNIRLGDQITITSPRGAYRYVVDQMFVVNPADVWVLDPSPDQVLTLVTCFPFDYHGSAPQRFIVRARTAVSPTPATASFEPDAVTCPAND